MKRLLIISIIILAYLTLFNGCGKNQISDSSIEKTEKIKVFVTILPQKEFVQAVGGNRVEIYEMIPPGFSPATYEPRPSQMASLAEARAYFQVGQLPFEKTQLAKIKSTGRNLDIFNTSEGIQYRKITEEHHHHQHQDDNHDHQAGNSDPHTWLSPVLVKIQIDNIARGLSHIDPVNTEFYQANAKEYQRKLDQLDKDLRKILTPLKGQSILVYHGAFGYFTDHYNLKQLVIEEAGREPTLNQIEKIIQISNQNKIKIVFTQAQFDTKTAKVIADEINGVVIPIDPLASNYLENMLQIAQTIQKNL